MSVQSDISSIQYTGNGSAATPYPVPFVFHEAVHLKAVVVAEDGTQDELALGTDYVVAGVGSKTGGSVTTLAPVPTTRKLTIYREVPVVQQSKFVENGPMPASTIERGLDDLTMIAQQLSRRVARSFRLSDSSPPLDPMMELTSGDTGVMVMGDDGKFHLWSMQRLKEELSAMAAVPAMLNALMVQYPVGCLYFTRRNENPRDILGFGTWVRFGAGRMMVSLDPSNPTLSQVGATGGAAVHSLTLEEGPAHQHVVPAFSGQAQGGGHTHTVPGQTVQTSSSGGHTHPITGYEESASANRPTNQIIIDDDYAQSPTTTRNTGEAGAHVHSVTIASVTTGTSSSAAYNLSIPEQNTRSAGQGKPHNNMPPYIVVHVWTRVNNDAPEDVDDGSGGGVGSLPFPGDPTLFVDRVTGETRRLVVDDSVLGTIPAGGGS
ncbi:MAG TPA: hypothetical protein VNQ90_17675 [Chthoniobacteraceae bacterium]|nr:hypothetical protein [Chthoniobacteraceae bacterium]